MIFTVHKSTVHIGLHLRVKYLRENETTLFLQNVTPFTIDYVYIYYLILRIKAFLSLT